MISLEKAIRIERQKNISAARLRWYKLINWSVHVESAEKFLLQVSEDAKEYNFFEVFRVRRDDSHRLIQLAAGQQPITGFIEISGHGERTGSKSYAEHGATLSIAQAADGMVIVTLYPYGSEKSKRKQNHIIWKILDNPSGITSDLLTRAVKDFFCYMRVSSVLLSDSRFDRLRIYYLEFRCKKYIEGINIYKAIFSHWFWIALGAISSFVTIYHH